MRARGHSYGPLLLHGFTGSSAAWPRRVVEGLTSVGRPPTCVDLPGHGRAGPAGPDTHGRTGSGDPDAHGPALGAPGGPGGGGRRFTLDAVFAVIHAALEEGLAPEVDGSAGGPRDLIGYSMGGRLALHYALAHRERLARLVLESASPGLASEAEREERRAADEDLAALLEREGIERFVERWEALPLFASQSRLDSGTRARHRRVRLSHDPRALAAALRGLGTGSLSSLWERLGELAVPTLVIAGALDRKFVGIAERMAGAMPHARLVVVPDAGHAVHLERPDAWVEAVTAFL